MRNAILFLAFAVALLWLMGTQGGGELFDEDELPVDDPTNGDDIPSDQVGTGNISQDTEPSDRQANMVLAGQFAGPSTFLAGNVLAPQFAAIRNPSFISFEEGFRLGGDNPPEPTGKNLPTGVNPDNLAAATVYINNMNDLHIHAKALAVASHAYMHPGAISQKKNKAAKDQLDLMTGQNARYTYLFGPGAHRSFFNDFATSLQEIGGLKTSGPCGIFGCEPPFWLPHNPGIYREGQNVYQVPDRTVGEIYGLLDTNDKYSWWVQVDGKNFRTAYNFVFELATLYALELSYKAALGAQESVLEALLKSAVSAGIAAIAGAAAGPWGMFATAAGSIAKDLVSWVDDLGQQSNKELAIEGKVQTQFSRFSKANGWKSFHGDNGYQFTSEIMKSKVKKFPANLWSQSATHQSIGTVGVEIEQGTYPGCALYSYFGFENQRFPVALDKEDYVSGSMWKDIYQARVHDDDSNRDAKASP